MQYVVSWSIEYDEESTTGPEDAAEQAWGDLVDAAVNHGPATILVVRDENDNHLGTFDMEGDSIREVRR